MRNFATILMVLAACNKDAADDTASSTAHQAGDYLFFTTEVTDACLEGALETLFMPEGPGNEHAFEYAIYVPGFDELPTTYNIDLRDPFVGMEVTVDSSDGQTLELRGSVMEDVLLGDLYGDCLVTMTVDADLVTVTSGDLKGEARIDISDPRGTEELCPVFDSDPCDVTLTLRGELQ